MTAKRRIRETNDTRECNKVNNMPFSVTAGEKAAILESIPDPVVLLDTDLKVLWSNAAMNKLLNLEADQLAGRHCFEKMHGLKKPCRICPVVKAIDTGRPCTVNDFSSLGKRWTLHAYPLLDDKGNVTRVVEIATDITESKRAEKKLNKICKLQSMILDNSTVGIAFVRNRIYEWVNPKLCELYGITKEQFVGSSTRIAYPDDESYQRIGNETYSLFAQGEKASFETLRRKGDGSLFWCKLEGIALDASKPQEGSIWIAEDITKRKQAEEELQKLNRLQSLILDNSAVGIAFVRNRTYEWVNRKMSELLGIPVEQLQGSSTRIIYPNDEVYQWVGSEAYPLFAQGRNVTLEVQLRKGNGSLILCNLKGIVLNPSTPLDGSIWIAEDITEHKLAEETLRKSEEKYRGLVEGLNEALFRMTLPDEIFEYFSPSVTNVLGYSAEEFIADPLLIRRAIHPDFQDYINKIFKELKEGIVSPNYEYKIIDAKGKERWIIQSNKGIFDKNGKLVALEGLCRDISERKRTEEALESRIVALTKPLEDIGNITFEDLFNISDLQHLQDMLAKAWGVAILLTNPDGTLITQPSNFTYFCSEFIRKNEKGFRNCQISDAALGRRHNPSGPTIQKCLSAGLWGAGASITLGGRHIGNWLIGQVRNEAQSEEQIMKHAREIGADEEAFREAFLRVPVMPQEKFEQIAHTLFALANQLSAIAYQNIQQARFIAERKQAEKALRESEEKFRGIYEESPMGIELYDREGTLLDINRACLDIFGISDVKNVIGVKLFENPNLREECKAQLRRGESVRLEMPYDFGKVTTFNLYETTKSGIIYLDVLITPLKGATKESGIGYLVHTRDITKRKQAEFALRESEEKYRRLHESMTEAFASTDMKGRIVESNRAYQSMLGYSEEELRHLSYSDITPKKWHALEKSIVKEQILVHGYSNVYEKEYQRKDGSVFPVEISAFLIRDSDGNPIGIWGIARDISERKKMETELNAARDYLRTVFNNVYDAIFVHDLDGKIIDVNNKMLEMYKVSREEVIGLNVIRDFSATDETIEVSRANWNKVMSGTNYFVPWKARRPKDCSVFDVEVFLTRLVLPDGNYILANVRDITERKQMEEERSRIEDRMRDVQKLESLGVLAGGIAHDFNNLLMSILGRADLALFSLSETSPAYQHVEEITRASHRAADLCRQMLAYSGKGRFVIGRYNISDIVREMGQILNVSISKNAMMRYSLAEGLPAVESDATQIRQVVMNLITNASDALGDGQGIISVKTGVMDCDEAYLSSSYLDDKLPGGTYVYLEVSDTGCGMDSETLSRIFDPFFSKKFTGRGLGLAAVLGIVRGHKGAIKVYSEVGKGTIFKILFPAVEWKPGDKVKTEEQPPLLKGGGTILVVDDDPLVRDVASDMLIQLGFQVLTANNGREGLEVFKTHGNEVSFIILDLTMPEMGGEEAFLELRKLRQDVKVILSSGYNEQDVTQRFVGKGLAGFIQKPYTLAGLRSALNRALG
ncbi:MAG: PAS domain S-box protein [Smithella sp.]